MYNPSDHYVHTLAIVPGDEVACKERVRAITQQFEASPEGKQVQEVLAFEKAHKRTNEAFEEGKKKISPYRATW